MVETYTYEVDVGLSFFESLCSIISSVNYFDIPILAYMTFITLWFFLLHRFQNYLSFLTFQFFASILSVSSSESLNLYFRENWRKFKFSKNYFDTDCLFVFIYWSLPHSIISVYITCYFFIDLCRTISIHRFFCHIANKETEHTEREPNAESK